MAENCVDTTLWRPSRVAVVRDGLQEMPFVFSPEAFVAEQGMYRFRCYPTARVERWTFWVAESTLSQLAPCRVGASDRAFGELREVVHQAALERMKSGAVDVEQVLTLGDFEDSIGWTEGPRLAARR
jgi:hypothetical protein